MPSEPPIMPSRSKGPARPALMVIDTAYTLQVIRELGNERSVTCRDLDGFFRHVWSVHPLASLLTSEDWTPRYGRADWHGIAPLHTFVEGKIGRFAALRSWFLPNFLIAQLGLFLTLLKTIKREKVAAVRGGDPLYQGLFAWGLARAAGIPLVIRVNGNNEKIRQTTGRPLYPRLFRTISMERRIEKFLFPRADLVVAPNQDNVDYAIAGGAAADRVAIFGYGNLLAEEHLTEPAERGCDAALFQRLGVAPGRYLLCIGRLLPLKFPDDAVRVLGRIVRREHDMKLLFAGEGDQREALAALAKSEGVADRVVFAGNQPQTALAQLNPHAAAVISPLTGRALSEAALGGAAIAAYDLDWQGDLIRNGESGELVPFRDVDALADAVHHLLSDPAHAAAMRRGARARALMLLDPDALNENERVEYRKLLGATL